MDVQNSECILGVLLSNIDDAHCLNRLRGLRSVGLKLKAAGFRRQYYRAKPEKEAVWNLGQIPNGLSLVRVVRQSWAVISIHRAFRECDCLYVFGSDNLLLAWLAFVHRWGKLRIFVEIADIREVSFGDNLL